MSEAEETLERELTGPEKAAFLLMVMGEEAAGPVLKRLGDRELRALGLGLPNVRALNRDRAQSVLREFRREIDAVPEVLTGAENRLREVAVRTLGERRARTIISGEELAPAALSDAAPRTLANLMRKERPQTIALLMTYTFPDKAADVLKLLPPELQADTALRMCELEPVPPDVVADVESALESEIGETASTSQTQKVGGLEMMAEIIGALDKTTEATLMELIETENPETAEEIRKLMFVFDDLGEVDEGAIREIMKRVETDTLLLALKSAPPELMDKFFRNMSKRAAEMAREDLEAMGPVRLSEVERARQVIVQAALALEAEGRIVLAGRGGDELV